MIRRHHIWLLASFAVLGLAAWISSVAFAAEPAHDAAAAAQRDNVPGADTVGAGAEREIATAVEHGGGHEASGHDEEHGDGNTVDPIHHVVDSRTLDIPWPNARLAKSIYLPSLGTIHVGGLAIEMAITKHVVMMWLVAALLFALVVYAGRRARPDAPSHGAANLVETVAVFIRDDVTIPAMGPHWGRTLLPYHLTLFFFILFANLLGLVPYGATPTGNISVTASLAVLSFLIIQGVAIREAGLLGWLKHLTGGVHWMLWPIMIPVEFLGLFTKPFALTVRLFANMTAGHIVILALLGLIFIFRMAAIAALSVPFSLFIMLLEILVAFIQAYIFTILTAVFTGLGVHAHHAEEHERDVEAMA